MQIYFLLEEKTFEQYADIAADRYYEEEARLKKEHEERMRQEQEQRQKKRQQKGKRDHGDSGINFSRGPPKFTSSKSKEFPPSDEPNRGAAAEESHRQVTYQQNDADGQGHHR